MAKWLVPSGKPGKLVVLPPPGDEPPVDRTANAPKERVLRQSLQLAKGQRGNEEAIYNIVEKSLDAGLFELAIEPARAFSPDSSSWMCIGASRSFRDPRIWRYLNKEFADYAARRVLQTPPVFAYKAEYTSHALGFIGLYR